MYAIRSYYGGTRNVSFRSIVSPSPFHDIEFVQVDGGLVSEHRNNDGEPHRHLGGRDAHRPHDVGRLKRTGGAGRPRRGGDAEHVEVEQQRFAFDVGEADVEGVGQAPVAVRQATVPRHAVRASGSPVITSYSIHYTKLYESRHG